LDAAKIADFISSVADEVPSFRLHIECPADFASTSAQLEEYAKLVALFDIRLFAKERAAHLIQIKMPDVGSIADTARAVLLCKENGVGAYVGGSCAETDLSARSTVHIAVATHADMMLAKPGMGVDEAISIVGNEQSRLLSVLKLRRSKKPNHSIKGERV
jgi:methylaspartate ammonia-lyase